MIWTASSKKAAQSISHRHRIRHHFYLYTIQDNVNIVRTASTLVIPFSLRGEKHVKRADFFHQKTDSPWPLLPAGSTDSHVPLLLQGLMIICASGIKQWAGFTELRSGSLGAFNNGLNVDLTLKVKGHKLLECGLNIFQTQEFC